ncbi:sodium:solute symporter family transporter, partial [Saccharopolyspora rectivirgula]|uniref:sodium:solute symporter family transporter n=1 Tax=Saccharopolyspora rectivirgula TaxID=28042 RepID=UPI003F67AD38
MSPVAQSSVADNRWLNIGIFALFVAVTMVIVFRASRNTKTATDYYAAGRSFSGPQNGIAISGDYLSAASFLGIAGAIAVYGYDGFLYSMDWSKPHRVISLHHALAADELLRD